MIYWNVPPGKRAIVRSVTAMSAAGTGEAVELDLMGVPVLLHRFPDGGGTVVWELHLVAYSGEQFGLLSLGPYSGATVSGYLMEDPTGRTGPPPSASTKPADELPPWFQ